VDWGTNNMQKTIAFRVDANREIGFGHLKRCVVLAKYLFKNKNINILFITKNYDVSLEFIKKESFEYLLLDRDLSEENESKKLCEILADEKIISLVIDLKEKIDISYVEGLIKTKTKIILLDNIGPARKIADCVIIPTEHLRKEKLIGTKKLYYGADYAIIDSENLNNTTVVEEEDNSDVTKILVSMGGGDCRGCIFKVLEALEKVNEDFKTTVIIGPAFTSDKQLEDFKKTLKKEYSFKRNVDNMLELMSESDMGILLFGVTAYEAAFTRLPSVILSFSERNKEAAELFKEFGTCFYIGDYDDVNEEDIAREIGRLLVDVETRKRFGENGAKLVDGQGVKRVSQIIFPDEKYIKHHHITKAMINKKSQLKKDSKKTIGDEL